MCSIIIMYLLRSVILCVCNFVCCIAIYGLCTLYIIIVDL